MTRKRKRKLLGPSKIRTFFIVVFILGILSTLGPYYIYSDLMKPVSSSNMEERLIVIPKGSSTGAIANILKDEKLIKSAEAFKIFVKLENVGGKFKAGKYSLSQSMNVDEIVKKLISGNPTVAVVKVTIPEGYELRMMAEKFAESGLCTAEEFLAAANSKEYDFEFVKDLPKRKNQLEGYLFPDTYEFYKDATPEQIVERMLTRFAEVYNNNFREQAEKRKLTTDEVVIMASIIEREAKMDNERKLVSSVFYNRVKKGIRLQSCATVQYILEERKPVLTFKDTKIKSPYNTYENDGLPPGPIAAPGLKSIEAALYPETSDYLYFVARNDGTSVFTKTYAEHLAAQRKIKNGN